MNLEFSYLVPVLADAVNLESSYSTLQFAGMILGVLGLLFFVGTSVGMIRFPDFYSRMHAAGKGDTLSTMLMLAGFGLVTKHPQKQQESKRIISLVGRFSL